MCVTELNVSLLPCRHRWYHLVRPCNPSTNLANCDKKLGISGWEIKCDFCPYCAEWNLSNAEYRLVGNDRSPTIGGLARAPSLSLNTARRESRSRRGSLSRTDSNTSITMMAQEKNRAMNARMEAYFRVPAPEATSVPAPLAEADDENVPSSPSDTSSEGPESLRHMSTSSSQSEKPSLLKKMRHRSKKLSMSMFK